LVEGEAFSPYADCTRYQYQAQLIEERSFIVFLKTCGLTARFGIVLQVAGGKSKG